MTAQRRLVLVRTALACLALSALSVGVPASFAPRSFYDDFPFAGTHWVALLPPYNEHLTTDVGGLQLAFGVLFAWAALRPRRELVLPVCAAWALSQVLHLAFHVTHLDGFGVSDAVGQTLALALVVALPAIPVVLLWRAAETLRPRGRPAKPTAGLKARRCRREPPTADRHRATQDAPAPMPPPAESPTDRPPPTGQTPTPE